MREEFIIPFDSVPFGINLFATCLLYTSADCGFIKQVIVFLSFICCLLILISCSEGANRLEEESFSFSEEDVQHENELGFYLYNDYASSIQSVSVTESSVKITVKYVGEGDFILGLSLIHI